MNPQIGKVRLSATEYDLDATLSSGQAFRWARVGDGWEGVVGERWVRLTQGPAFIEAEAAVEPTEWNWLERYLQTGVELEPILASFPDDEPMRRSVAACRGLRLLRQDPWECLASFILSSNKQIVQIRQIVDQVCLRYGRRIPVPAGHGPVHAFPGPEIIAATPEAELRACKMGFRAPNLRATAKLLVEKSVNLDQLYHAPIEQARAELLTLPGVGRKIADCVLLFAYDFPAAFPVDVWVRKVLQQLYFARRRPTPRRLERFLAQHFGPNAGYAQQYLFHHARMLGGLDKPSGPSHARP